MITGNVKLDAAIEDILTDLDYLYTNIVPDNCYIELVKINYLNGSPTAERNYYLTEYNSDALESVTFRYKRLAANSFVYDGKEVRQKTSNVITRYDENGNFEYTYELNYDTDGNPLFAQRSDGQVYHHAKGQDLPETFTWKGLLLPGCIFGWTTKNDVDSVYFSPEPYYDIYKKRLIEEGNIAAVQKLDAKRQLFSIN